MKLLPIVTLVIAGAVLASCGTTRDNRYNETAYADSSAPDRTYQHDVVYRSPAYVYDDDDDVDVVYVRPAYRTTYTVVPVVRDPVYYDGYYYYRY